MIELTVTEVTPENVRQETLFCIKDLLNPGFKCKEQWINARNKEGLKMLILKDEEGQKIGFIEYIPASRAWRPVSADNFMFIQCMYIYPNKNKNKGHGSELIKAVETDAKQKGMHGVCVVSSSGPWMADKRIFEKNGYSVSDKKDRFELLCKKWQEPVTEPVFLDWSLEQVKYDGWHLLYADQCPWHDKSAYAIKQVAEQYGLDLKIKKITSSEDAKHAPSGYGVFNLLHDGKLLEDHYISATRFKNIIKKELQL
ncbi:MAG: GNAT family N-acetyltransferase [Flavobacteriaceae bacterium]